MRKFKIGDVIVHKVNDGDDDIRDRWQLEELRTDKKSWAVVNLEDGRPGSIDVRSLDEGRWILDNAFLKKQVFKEEMKLILKEAERDDK